MDLSIRRLCWFGVMLIVVCLAGCSQPAGGDLALPISPSAVLAGPSASLPAGDIARLGPGASYNATGIWHFVVSNVHGEVDETFDVDMHQDADGNLSFIDDDGNLINLTRLGSGVVVTYRLSFISDEEPCDFKVTGTARLDTRSETITINAALQDTDCSHSVLVITATK
jgi:hypothetical protein